MDDLDAQQLRACLRSWHGPLRELGSLQWDNPSTASAGERILWLHSEYHKKDDDRHNRYSIDQPRLSRETLEGLFLLSMLARVDKNMFWSEIKEIWNDDVGLCRWIAMELAASQTVGGDAESVVVGFSWVAATVENLTSFGYEVQEWYDSSEMFNQALRLLKLEVSKDDTFKVPVRLGVGFKLEASRYQATEAFNSIAELCVFQEHPPYSEFDEMYALADQYSDSDDEWPPMERPHPGVQMRVVQFVGVPSIVTALKTRGLEALAKISALGVEIDGVPDLECSM